MVAGRNQSTRKLDRFGNRLGEFVEDRVTPAVDRLFQARGLKVQRSLENLVCYEDDYQYRDQVALLVIAGDTAIAVACKSNLSVEDGDEHLDRLARFKDCWPEYAGYRLVGTHPLAQPPRPLARPDPPLARLRPRPSWPWL